jgi:hypothetical protein
LWRLGHRDEDDLHEEAPEDEDLDDYQDYDDGEELEPEDMPSP